MAASKTKAQQVEYIENSLKEKPYVIFSQYSGMSVKDITELRGQLREKNLEFKVVKLNLFKLAWKNVTNEEPAGFENIIKGQLAVTFGGEDLPVAAKTLKDFAKTKKQLEIKGGYFDGQVLDEDGVEAIAGLPTKEEVLAMIARGLNAPATQLAQLTNEIIAQLARAIKAVGEKNN